MRTYVHSFFQRLLLEFLHVVFWYLVEVETTESLHCFLHILDFVLRYLPFRQLIEWLFPINVTFLYNTILVTILHQSHIRLRDLRNGQTISVNTDCLTVLCQPVSIELYSLSQAADLLCFTINRYLFSK